MRKFIIIFAILIGCQDNSEDMRLFQTSLGSVGNTPPPQTVYVFLLTGQSNAVGFVPNADAEPSELTEKTTVKIWQKDGDFENMNINEQNNYAREGLFENGMELGWGIQQDLPLYLIKWGVGSTSITQHLSGGPVYEEFYNNFVIPGLARISELYPNSIIDLTLVFWQGENDSNSQGLVDAYPARFDSWVSLWQSNLGADLPIRVLQINETTGWDVDINNVFANKELTESYLDVIDTQGLPMIDVQHFGYEAKKICSQRVLDTKGL